MLGRTDRPRRMAALLLVFVVLATAASVRLGYWQMGRPDLAQQARSRLVTAKEPRPARASILDRSGDVLAQSATVDQLEVHPVLIRPEQRANIIELLTPILDLAPWQQESYLETLSNGKEWDVLERRLTRTESLAIAEARAAGDLPGVSLTPQEVRRYPVSGGQGGNVTLASHLLGVVTGDRRGAAGVEAYYDARLRGEQVAPGGDPPALASLVGGVGAGGSFEVKPLTLTIDAGLQRQVERELNAARIATVAESVSAIVMDPYTGEVLATASAPGYDANDLASLDRLSLLRDPTVSDVYEPGSVMKIFTAAAALDQGVVTPQTRIMDVASIQFHGARVDNATKDGMGPTTVQDIVAYSRNVGITRVAERLAPGRTDLAAKRLFAFWEKVGLVGKTGVDIAGEEQGIWCDPSTACPWHPVDLSNRAFGQGVGVTLMQLATGYATLINGGFRVRPHIVADDDITTVVRERVLRPKISKQATQILVHVTGAVPWYADDALIPGYLTGGKTGTAQIWDSRTRDWKVNRDTGKEVFNHSFIGFVGRDRPQYLIALRIEEPRVKITGQGEISAKVQHDQMFERLARAAIKHLDIRKSRDPDAGLPILGTEAARKLTPDRTREERRLTRRSGAPEDRQGRGRDAGTEATSDGGGTQASDRSQP